MTCRTTGRWHPLLRQTCSAGLVAAGDEVTVYGSTSSGWEEFDESAPYRARPRADAHPPADTDSGSTCVGAHRALATGCDRVRCGVPAGAPGPPAPSTHRYPLHRVHSRARSIHGPRPRRISTPALDGRDASAITSYRAGAGTFCNRLSVQAPATNCCRLRSTPPSTPESTAHGSGRDTASVKTPWSSRFTSGRTQGSGSADRSPAGTATACSRGTTSPGRRRVAPAGAHRARPSLRRLGLGAPDRRGRRIRAPGTSRPVTCSPCPVVNDQEGSRSRRSGSSSSRPRRSVVRWSPATSGECPTLSTRVVPGCLSTARPSRL